MGTGNLYLLFHSMGLSFHPQPGKMLNNPCGLDWAQNQGFKEFLQLVSSGVCLSHTIFWGHSWWTSSISSRIPTKLGAVPLKGLSQVFYGQGRCAELREAPQPGAGMRWNPSLGKLGKHSPSSGVVQQEQDEHSDVYQWTAHSPAGSPPANYGITERSRLRNCQDCWTSG